MTISFTLHGLANAILANPKRPLPAVIYDLCGTVPTSDESYKNYIVNMQELFHWTPDVQLAYENMSPTWKYFVRPVDGTLEKEPLVLFSGKDRLKLGSESRCAAEVYLQKFPLDETIWPYLQGCNIYAANHQQPKYVATLAAKIRVALSILKKDDREITWEASTGIQTITYSKEELIAVIRRQIGNTSRAMPTIVSVVNELQGLKYEGYWSKGNGGKRGAMAEYLSWYIRDLGVPSLKTWWEIGFGYYDIEMHSRPSDTYPLPLDCVYTINGAKQDPKTSDRARDRFLAELDEYVTRYIQYSDMTLEKYKGKRKSRFKMRPCIRRARLVSWNRIMEMIHQGPSTIRISY